MVLAVKTLPWTQTELAAVPEKPGFAAWQFLDLDGVLVDGSGLGSVDVGAGSPTAMPARPLPVAEHPGDQSVSTARARIAVSLFHRLATRRSRTRRTRGRRPRWWRSVDGDVTQIGPRRAVDPHAVVPLNWASMTTSSAWAPVLFLLQAGLVQHGHEVLGLFGHRICWSNEDGRQGGALRLGDEARRLLVDTGES